MKKINEFTLFVGSVLMFPLCIIVLAIIGSRLCNECGMEMPKDSKHKICDNCREWGC
jgi:hypothetical protein